MTVEATDLSVPMWFRSPDSSPRVAFYRGARRLSVGKLLAAQASDTGLLWRFEYGGLPVGGRSRLERTVLKIALGVENFSPTEADAEFAQLHEAEVGVEGVLLRTGFCLNVILPDGDQVSVLLSEKVARKATKLFRLPF